MTDNDTINSLTELRSFTSKTFDIYKRYGELNYKILLAINKLTSPYRHGNGIKEQDIIDLCNKQIDFETEYYKIGEEIKKLEV